MTDMTVREIVAYPGDGIGKEVAPEAIKVLRAAMDRFPQLQLNFTTVDWGITYWRKHGTVVPEDFLTQLQSCDAILLGAVGWPDELSDHTTLAPLVQIRQSFDQYACVRPAKLLPGVPSVLTGKGVGDIDLMVVRENSEGEYVNQGGRFKIGQPGEVAVQSAVHTRKGITRIIEYSCALARKRRGKVTMITKSNAMGYAYVLWDEILEEIVAKNSDLEFERQHCDAAAMNFVRRPEAFDVVVASNLFGDLLTDLAGVIGGGLGLAPSTNIHPDGKYPSMFEPVHGSAPDIAGQGIANPVAAVLSAAMMLEHLGFGEIAQAIEVAVAQTLVSGVTTPDLGGSSSTCQVGDAIAHALGGVQE